MENKSSKNLRREKVTRYSIRKYSFGAASVAVAALFMFLGNGAVSANELSKQDTPDVGALAPAPEHPSTAPESAPVHPTVEEPTKPAPAPTKPVETPKPAAPEATTPALDTTKLEKYIAEIEAKLDNGTYANKTEASIALLKADLEAAKATLRNAKTQDEITKAYNKLVATANTKLITKPVEKKETPGVDTTNGKETVGKRAENTEPKEGTNAIENTGSHDSRNGKVMENGSGFRAAVTPKHEEFTRTEGDITYSVEFSDDKLKEIYVYNKEEANVEFKINSKTNKVSYVETTKGSSQKFNTVDGNTVTDGYGYYFKKITTDTDTPLTVAMTGQPNAGIMASANYTKTEDQAFAMGDRYLRVTAKGGTSMSSPDNGADKAGYFKIVLKSQTYKYQPEKIAYADKVSVANLDKLTETELANVKNHLKLIYSTTSTDARLSSVRGGNAPLDVVDTVTESGRNFVITYKDGSKDTVSKGLFVKNGPAPVVDTKPKSRDTIFSTDDKITGTGVAGATVKVTVRNPEKTNVLFEKETTVNAQGKWEISLDKGLNSNEALSGAKEPARTFHVSKPKNPVEIIQTVDGIDSEAKNQEVSIGSSQILPSAASTDGKSVVAGASEVTLKVPHDSGFTYFWYTNKDNNQRPQFDIKRTDDGNGFVMSGENAGKARIKEVVKGDFYDTITLTLTENIKEGVDLEVISHNGVATHGYHLGRTKIAVTNEAPVVSAVEENKNEKEVPTDASVTKADLLRLVKVTDHEDDLSATLGTKGNARIVSIDGDENAVKVDTSTAGEHTVIFRAVDSQGKESADYTYKIKVRQNNAPEVTIPYSIDGKKDVYVYANENFDIPIKYTDDTGKVVEASIRQGGNKELSQKAGQNDPNVLDNQYNMTVGKISAETTATAEKPATIHITGNLSKTTSGLDANKFPTDENGEYPIVTRYATATDTDGKNISNNATGSSYATDPGGFRIVLKAQTAKYDVKALDDEHKIVVSDTGTMTKNDLDKVKASLQLEYSKKNKDKNIDKTAEVTPGNVGNAVDTVAQDGTNLVVTYKDGSKDTIALDKVVKLDKQPAIDDVNKKATEQIAAINGNDNLTKAEKDAAINKVNEAKQAALDKIDDATNAADVKTFGTDGATAVEKVNPVAKDAAKKDIDKELKAKTDAIDAKTDLSDKEKEAAKAKAQKAADDAKAKIDKLADTAETADAATNAVNPGKQQATDNLAKVNPVAKEKALAKIDEALKAKEKEMDDRTDLTAEEKAEAKAEAKAIADAKKAIIKGKNDNEETVELATAAQTAINTAGTDGERDIKAVTKEAKVKPAAHKAVADAAEAKKQNIQENSALSDAAKEALKNEVDAIKEASKAAIDGAKKNADVEAAKKSAKAAIDAINSARLPGNKIVAANPRALTSDEIKKVEDAIRAVNPEGTTIVVKADGSAEVTLPGKKAPEIFKQEDLTRGEADLENPGGGNNINRPMDKVIVKNPGDLQPEEKEKILKAVRDVNPNAVVTINAAGVVTVSTPEGKTAAFPASELVRTLEDAGKDGAANTGVLKPADKLVGDATNADDQAKVTEKLKKLNGQDTKVKYDAEGNATVTSIETKPDGTKVYKTATIPAGDLFKTEEDTKKANGGDDINKPNSKTVVEDIAALSPEELEKVKDAIKAKVEAVNPGAVVVVDNKGNAIVTTPEGKTAVIDADDLIKKSTELPNAKAGNNINNPADRVRVGNKESLQPEEIAKIKAAVEAVNPGATVVVDAKGNATVTTPDSPGVEGKTATIPVSELVKVDGDKTAVSGGNQVNTPADRVVLEKAIADLTPDELNKLKEDITAKVKAVNPDATVVVDEKGNATVTTPDSPGVEGKTATIPVADLVKAKTDLADPTKQDAVNKPADKLVIAPELVDNSDADLSASKDAIKAAVEAVNPGSTVVVDEKGNATVTTKDGKTVVIPKADLVKKESDKENAKAGNSINKPVDRILVTDPANIDEATKKAIEEKVKAVNPDATVVVDEEGNATVTSPDGKTATIPVAELVKTEADKETAKAGNNVNKPADKVSAKPADLEGADKETLKTKIADAIKAVNPEGTKVFVDDKGNATVTTPEGKTATIPVEDLLKNPDDKNSATAGNKVNTPADRVILDKDIAALSPEELAKVKEKIADKVKAVNPDATVFVDDKGNATVTTKDGAVATIPAADLLKAKTDLTDPAKQPAVKIPVDETVVANKDGLSGPEKTAIQKAVESVNPGATVFVDEKGNATVTTPDGKTAVIAADDLVKTQEDVSNDPKAGNLVNKPADRVFVGDEGITEGVKDKIKDKVQRVNPDATVFVDENGNAIVTTPEGKTVTIPVGDLTKTDADKEKVKAGNKISTPADRVLVKNREHLTAEDIAAIEKNIKAVNPDKDENNPTVVLFDEKGNATVTVTDSLGTKTTATIPVEDLVKPVAYLTNPDKQDLIKKPVDKVLVTDPANIDKEAIKKAVLAVNPKEGTTVVVDDKGNATITTKDGKTFVIPAKDLVKSEEEAKNEKAGNDINKPSDKVVADTSKPLTDEAKEAIAKKIKAVNPDAKTITVFVDDEGNATVTVETKDENGDVNTSTATILAKDLVRTEEQAKGPNAGNNVNTPADKVVADPDKLTDTDKTAIAENIKSVNPEAKVAFDKYGNATVTTKDGAIATIPVKNLVKTQDEATKPTAGNNVNKPADKVVADPADFNDNDKKVAIKKAIEDNIKAVNPGALVAVDDLGNATVTLPNGKTAVIPAKDLTKPSAEVTKPKAGNDIVKPADKTVVANPDALTDDERNAIGAKVSEVNPDAKYIAVDDKGNVTVTLNDGKVAVIPASDLTKSAGEAAKPKAGNDVVKPADKTVVANPDALTEDEKKAIIAKIKAVNPDKDAEHPTKVVLDEKGNATVTLPNGKTAVIPAKELTKKDTDEDNPKAGNDIVKPASKVKVATPGSLTPEEKKAIEDKVKAVNPEGTTVVVDEKGNATVTKKDGTVLNIPASDLVIPAAKLADEAKNAKVKTPAFRTLVGDKENLKDFEKEAVKKAIEAVNPGATVVVDNQGNATVTLPDGSTATISKEQLVKDAKDAKGKHRGDNLDFDFSKVTVENLEKIKDKDKVQFQFMILGAITNIPEFDLSSLEIIKDDQGNTIYKSGNGAKMIIDKNGNATIVTKDGKKQAAISIDEKGNVTIVTKDGKVLTIPRDDAFRERVYYSQADSKTDKSKLESAIHQLDELIINQSDKLDENSTKEAKALLEEAKKVFANADATQAEVDAMVKRIEDFMAKVAPSTDHATPANDQAAQTPANASQEAANARKAAKELPNTGTADSTVAMVVAAASALLGLGLAGRRRKEDEEA